MHRWNIPQTVTPNWLCLLQSSRRKCGKEKEKSRIRIQVLCHFLGNFSSFSHTQSYPYCSIETQRKWIIPSSKFIFIFTFLYLVYINFLWKLQRQPVLDTGKLWTLLDYFTPTTFINITDQLMSAFLPQMILV